MRGASRKIGEAHARAVAQTLGLDGGLVLRAIGTSMISLVEWGALAEQGETPEETASMWRDNLNRRSSGWNRAREARLRSGMRSSSPPETVDPAARTPASTEASIMTLNVARPSFVGAEHRV